MGGRCISGEMRRWILLAFLVAGCGGEPDGLTIYLPQHLGPEGPHGQRVPVLMPVERERRETMSSARQAVLELMIGPAPDERARGFSDALHAGTRADRVRVRDRVAEVDLAGPEPTFLGSAAIVYSVAAVPGVRAVRLLRYGKPCCFYPHAGMPVTSLHTRKSFRGWPGEPCALRTYAHAVRCRGDF
jgi:hypothetical protein